MDLSSAKVGVIVVIKSPLYKHTHSSLMKLNLSIYLERTYSMHMCIELTLIPYC